MVSHCTVSCALSPAFNLPPDSAELLLKVYHSFLHFFSGERQQYNVSFFCQMTMNHRNRISLLNAALTMTLGN